MSDDWKAGDLALCVRLFEPAEFPMPVKGRVYQVLGVSKHSLGQRWGAVALHLDGLAYLGGNSGWNSNCFIKVTPPEADAEDLETIELLKSGKVSAHD